jgi:hypothetical protein
VQHAEDADSEANRRTPWRLWIRGSTAILLHIGAQCSAGSRDSPTGILPGSGSPYRAGTPPALESGISFPHLYVAWPSLFQLFGGGMPSQSYPHEDFTLCLHRRRSARPRGRTTQSLSPFVRRSKTSERNYPSCSNRHVLALIPFSRI